MLLTHRRGRVVRARRSLPLSRPDANRVTRAIGTSAEVDGSLAREQLVMGLEAVRVRT
jgi:hypothetical protein